MFNFCEDFVWWSFGPDLNEQQQKKLWFALRLTLCWIHVNAAARFLI